MVERKLQWERCLELDVDDTDVTNTLMVEKFPLFQSVDIDVTRFSGYMGLVARSS